ncbi:MAG TPA: TetR/AcrR family transcriptional regulator [Ramlibacter sp.]|uniref:TetR/AcrR family transcriptional regulator n=1 Tax=Ramlibacter sp. TaxID=1917967 RepID=UPI002B66A70D|nr:TetR/AcrR family transcriptional regulator [Ramlibacter sp.]HVZ42211.1 TetR/AcrR family transcriptional regulator [Ramlibacter sp.]
MASSTRELILRGALHCFSSLGYAGASMREIAEAAGVTQGLLHYHFKSKDGLYDAVFEYCSQKSVGHRGHLLDELLATNPVPSLEELLAVLFTPVEGGSKRDRAELTEYVQMVAAVDVANDERSRKVVARYFDPIGHRFVDEFRRAIPALDKGTAVWCYLFAIGARMQAQALNGRAERMCQDKKVAGAVDANQLLIHFIAAGIRDAAARSQAISARDARSRSSAVIASSAAARKGKSAIERQRAPAML